MAAPPGAPKAPEPAQEARRFRLKREVDGKPVEEELGEEEVQLQYQKWAAAEKMRGEAEALRRRFQDAIAAGRDDPERAFKDLFGLDLDEYATKRIAEKFREATLTPEEQERLKLERERDDYKRKLETYEAQRKLEAKRAYEEKVWAETEHDVLEALKLGGFEKSKAMLHMVADVADAALDYNVRLSPAQMVAEANRRMGSFVKQVLPSLKGERLLEFLGEDAVKEVLRSELARRRMAPPTPQVQKPAAEPQPAQRKPMSPTEFRNKHLFGLGG